MQDTRPQPVAYGIANTTTIRDEIDEKVEEIRFNGYCVLRSALDDAKLEQMRSAIDRAYQRQSDELRAEGGVDGQKDADLVLAPLAYDPIFMEAALDKSLLELCRRILGENFVLLQQNAIINRPSTKHYQVQWHRDLNYQHWVSSQPICLSALYCIDEFSAEMGGTLVLPGTHLREEFPSDKYILKHERQMTEKPGSILVFDSMLFHRAGANVTRDRTRRALNHVIGRPFLAQQIDLPRVLQGKYADDPFLAKYLGYRWNPAQDVRAWRLKKR